MQANPSRCADLHTSLQQEQRYPFSPPLVELPLNSVYFIFEMGQSTHGGADRVVRIGSERGWNTAKASGQEGWYEVNEAPVRENGGLFAECLFYAVVLCRNGRDLRTFVKICTRRISRRS